MVVKPDRIEGSRLITDRKSMEQHLYEIETEYRSGNKSLRWRRDWSGAGAINQLKKEDGPSEKVLAYRAQKVDCVD